MADRIAARSARPPLVVGSAVAATYVVVAVVCLLAVTSPDRLLSGNQSQSRAIGFVPYVVLAVSLLVVGLAHRRWWQAPLAPVVLVAGSWWWLTWDLHLPQRIADNDWTVDHALSVSDAVATTWRVVATAVVVVGWGLVRRSGGWWALGLVPSAVLIGVSEVVQRAVAPDGGAVGESAEDFLQQVSHELRVGGVVDIVLVTLTVVACVWLCALAEEHQVGRRTTTPA